MWNSMYRSSYFTAYDTVSLYYKVGWQLFYIGAIVVNAPLFIMQFIAMFGVAINANLIFWDLMRHIIHNMLFITTVGLLMVGMYQANEATNKAMVDAIMFDVAILLGAEAWQLMMYKQHFAQWNSHMNGMLMA